MNNGSIKNFSELATTPNRTEALQVAQAGLEAINTERIIASSISLDSDILSIKGENFDLSRYKRIKVVGFGKASVEAALALEKILGEKITGGAVIGLAKADLKHIETFAGTHPRPSQVNTIASQRIYEILRDSREDDLVIALISGGGSALLCYPESECGQGIRLYDSFLGSGKTIREMNTVRKHLSSLKGGGLARLAYPATVVGLVFSDVAGNVFENVASGPTYKDTSTIEDAKRIIQENNLGEFELTETPKDDKYFEKVHNFVLVSNTTAVDGMAKKAEELGLGVKIVSTELYDEIGQAAEKIFSARADNAVALAAGEPSLLVTKKGGKGGRSLQLCLQVIKKGNIDEKSVFIALASDGMDNSDAAGAIADKNTALKAEKLGLKIDEYFNNFDSYTFFEKTGDLIMTGPTGANVSDLMILLTKE